MKKHVTKRDPATFDQLYRRWMFFFAQSNWGALENVDKLSWSDLADFYKVSNNNAYLGTNMERWDRFDVPSAYLPIQETGDVGTMKNWVVTKDANRVKLFVRVQPVAQNWGCILYAQFVWPPNHARDTVIQINLLNDSHEHFFYFYPPASGTWRFQISIFSHNGERYDFPLVRTLIWP